MFLVMQSLFHSIFSRWEVSIPLSLEKYLIMCMFLLLYLDFIETF